MPTLEELETGLVSRGFTPEVNKAIRNAKICIVDDRVADLEGFVDGLKAEGFSNIVELEQVDSVNELFDEQFELIVLDIHGVASALFADDGLGVLGAIKKKAPWILVLVISGTKPDAEASLLLSQADAVRNKPVLPSDLVSEVEDLLKYRKDAYWAGLAVLQEVRKLQPDIAEKLSIFSRIKLWWYQRKLIGDIEARDPQTTSRVLAIANTTTKLGLIGVRITKIAKGLG